MGIRPRSCGDHPAHYVLQTLPVRTHCCRWEPFQTSHRNGCARPPVFKQQTRRARAFHERPVLHKRCSPRRLETCEEPWTQGRWRRCTEVRKKFYHHYSHITRLTIASTVSFSEPGVYVGASFDHGKIKGYRKEVIGRLGLA